MTSRLPRQQPPAWLGYFGMIVVVAGIIYQAGGLNAQIERNDERLTKLEASDQARSERIQMIDVRTARIEAKIDFLVPVEAKKR